MQLNEFNSKASVGQRAVLSAKERFPVVVTGIQAGKTTVGAVWRCMKIYADYEAGIQGDYLIAAPTVKILQQSTLPKFKEILPHDWAVWKESSKVFELKWGGHIYVRSTDDPDYLEGMTIRAAWLDEAGQMKQTVWTNVQGRLSIAQGPCLMTTTPYSMGWFWREIVKKAHATNSVAEENGQFVLKKTEKSGDVNIALFSWPSNANPGFPQEEFERAKASMAPALFERRYLGKFTQLEGLVYPDFKQDLDVVVPFAVPMEWGRHGGHDFGKENPTCILTVAHDSENDIYYVIKEFYKSNSFLEEQANFINENGMRMDYADPQSAQLIHELRNTYHCPIQGADNDIDSGIQRLTALFRSHRLKIFSTCVNLLEELETYHYPKKDGETESNDKPVAKKNHACDALRYAFSKGKAAKLKPLNPLDQNIRSGKKRRFTPDVTRATLTHDKFTGY